MEWKCELLLDRNDIMFVVLKLQHFNAPRSISPRGTLEHGETGNLVVLKVKGHQNWRRVVVASAV
jgi:hypothetical protein